MTSLKPNMDDTMTDQELPPSELGTKEYWDQQYGLENDNFDQHGDEGEVWFGEDAMNRVIRWMVSHPALVPKDRSHILDLGCGNGRMCLELSCEGFSHVTGIDFSGSAIQLARKIAQQHNVHNILFHECDLVSMNQTLESLFCGFDVCVDKGTYDAISLNPEGAAESRKAYIEHVFKLLRPEGLLIITSCNWTEHELMGHFRHRFRLHSQIATPQFRFGGQVGNMVTSLILQKHHENGSTALEP